MARVYPDVVVKLITERAANDIACAVLCMQTLRNRNVALSPDYGPTKFESYFNGAFELLKRVTSGRTTQGSAPVSFFQVFSYLRPRNMTLGEGRGFNLQVVALDDHFDTSLPAYNAAAGPAGMSDLLAAFKEITGGTDVIDLGNLSNADYQFRYAEREIAVGRSVGPLSIASVNSDKFWEFMMPKHKRVSTECWMNSLGWAYSYVTSASSQTSPFYEYQIYGVLFPAYDNRNSQITPGYINLVRSLQNAAVVFCDTFEYPSASTVLWGTFLAADLSRRKLKIPAMETSGTLNDDGVSAFWSRMAERCLARVGVESGQAYFAQMLQSGGNVQLPSGPVEASCLRPVFRNSNATIPIVVGQLYSKGPVPQSKFYATSTEDLVQYESIVGAVSQLSLMNNFTSIFYPAYSLGSGASVIQPKTRSSITYPYDVWGVAPVVGSNYVEMGISDAVDIFTDTISKGPLSRPLVDMRTGTLNMLDARMMYRYTGSSTADPWNIDLVGGSIDYNGGSVKVPSELNQLAMLPLTAYFAHLSLAPGAGRDISNERVPATRSILNATRLADTAALELVTEASAKRTIGQEWLNQLTVLGLGGDGLLGDIVGGVKLGARVAKALGFQITPGINRYLQTLEEFIRSQQVKSRNNNAGAARAKAPPPPTTGKKPQKKVVPNSKAPRARARGGGKK